MGQGKLVSNDLRGSLLVPRVRVGMQETDCYPLHLQPSKFPSYLPDLGSVDGVENFPIVAGSLRDLETMAPGNQGGQSFYLEVVQFGPVLAANLKDVTKAPGRYQPGLSIPALEKRVRREGRRVDYCSDTMGGDPAFLKEFFNRLQSAHGRVRRGR